MKLLHINDVAAKIHLKPENLIHYGEDKAKIKLDFSASALSKGKLILVSAITPTSAGEGKTTMAIALQDGMRALGKDSLLCLREPSLGPVFGLKGGATGAGKARVQPTDDINLHFTGDIHALTSSVNLIAAVIENHIFQGNELQINPQKIMWKRALDINDRGLREINVGLGKNNGVKRRGEFQITAASELMAILCLSADNHDFRKRVDNIIIGYSYGGEAIRLEQLNISNAIYYLMEKALYPNLVQTEEGNPVLIHGGPFANIAHGCNSLIATKYALSKADYVITEAGFASDLGAEKFFNIKCRVGGLSPSLTVLVTTTKALKAHGGVSDELLGECNVSALTSGMANLDRHYQNLKKFGVRVLVAVNKYANEHDEEIEALTALLEKRNYLYSFVTSFNDGGQGALDFAAKVSEEVEKDVHFAPLYALDLPIKEKIEIIVKEIYRGKSVKFSKKAKEKMAYYESHGFGNTPVCMAKTHLSFSDNPLLKNAPDNFVVTIRDFNLSAGANFIVALTGDIMTMPGLPKKPAAVNMKEVR